MLPEEVKIMLTRKNDKKKKKKPNFKEIGNFKKMKCSDLTLMHTYIYIKCTNNMLKIINRRRISSPFHIHEMQIVNFFL